MRRTKWWSWSRIAAYVILGGLFTLRLVIDQQSPQSLMTAAVGDTTSVALMWVGESAAYLSLAQGPAMARPAPRTIHPLPHVSAQLRGQAGDQDGILLSPKMAASITASIASHTAADAESPGEIFCALVWSSLRVRPCPLGSMILCSDFRACSNEISAQSWSPAWSVAPAPA